MHSGIFDMHCHYLYGVDDGSKSPEMTLKMLDIAYSQGVRNVIMTPHYNPKVFHKDIEDLEKRFISVKKLVQKEGHDDMKLWLGSEIFYHKQTTPEEFLKGNVLSMAESHYILMEFHTNVEYSYIEAAVQEAESSGYIPIIAHVERFAALYGNEDNIDRLRQMGAFVQVNAGTVMGYGGFGAKRFVRKLLKYEMIDFIGTDAHRDAEWRVPNIGPAAEYIYKKCSESYADRIFIHNPRKVVRDEMM